MATEWTIATLKEHIDTLREADKEALLTALKANDRRLDLLNEFRAQASDEARKYAQTALVDQRFSSVEDRVARGENMLAQLQGRALALAGIGAAIGGVVGALIVKFIS